MDTSLSRMDLGLVGSNNRNLLHLLPPKKNKSKVVVGDDSGTVTCLEARGGTSKVSWKSAPRGGGMREVSAMCLGPRENPNKVKVFAAYGQTIRILKKKKGAEYFNFPTSLNESIKCMFVEGNAIYTSCDYIMSAFVEYKDTLFYMAVDRVNFMAMDRVVDGKSLDAILGCQDKFVRVLAQGELAFETRVPASVSTLLTMENIEGSFRDSKSVGRKVVYGMDDGVYGALDFTHYSGSRTWTADSKGHRAGISVLHAEDVFQSGALQLIVGHDDGKFEVVDFEEDDTPHVQFSRELGESITSIESGTVYGKPQKDLVLSTYSGKVLTYGKSENQVVIAPMSAPRSANSKTVDTPQGNTQQRIDALTAKQNEEKLASLTAEIAKLSSDVKKQKAKYKSVSSDAVIVSDSLFKVKHTFRLVPAEACHALSLELASPIDVVCLRTDVDVLALDTNEPSIVVTETPLEASSSTKLLCTYRSTDKKHIINRVELKLRVHEGEHGILRLYVVPQTSTKSCRMVEVKVKPLSMHERLDESVLEEEKERPWTVFTMEGKFSLNECHQWVGQCLPDIPERLPANMTECKYHFKSAFLQTVLVLNYSDNKAIFKSENPSAVSIVKEVVTKAATAAGKPINSSVVVHKDSIAYCLNVLKDDLGNQLSLERRVELSKPLLELQTQEGDEMDFLFPEYQEILNNKDKYIEQLKTSKNHLRFLRAILIRLYEDKFKLKGRRPPSTAGLDHILESPNYTFDALLKFFA